MAKGYLYLPREKPKPVITLYFKNMSGEVPYAWNLVDWEACGWNAAMRECAKRLQEAGLECVILPSDFIHPPNVEVHRAGEGKP